MKYMIVYLIKGKAKKYQVGLTNELSKKFGLYNLNNHIMPHLTLKVPFERKNIKEVEAVIKKFSSSKKPVKLRIQGFGEFNKSVVYLKIELSKEVKALRNDLLKELKNLPRMRFRKYDGESIPHATLVYAKDRKKFLKVWEYLSSRNPKYLLYFDNMAILKKPKNKWIIQKEFKIK